MSINGDYKYKEECEDILKEYRTEEVKTKVHKIYKTVDVDYANAIYKFFKNKELTTKEYQIMLMVIHDVIMKEHDKIERLIKQGLRYASDW